MVHVSSQRTQKPLLLKRRKNGTLYLGFVEGDLAETEASVGGVCVRGHIPSHLDHLVSASASALMGGTVNWRTVNTRAIVEAMLEERQQRSRDNSYLAKRC